MTKEKATALLQLGIFRLEGLKEGESRDDLEVDTVFAAVPSTTLAVAILKDGRAAALWAAHGSLHDSLEALLAPNRYTEAERASLGLPDPVLNSFEADRVNFIAELKAAGVMT